MTKQRLWLLVSAVLVSWFCVPCYAAYQWSNVAIGGGGFVSAIVTSKTQQNLIYARTDVGGAYRWDATSSRWIPLTDWVSEAEVGLLGVEAIALDPNNSARLYMLAGTSYFNNGRTVVLRSSDYGASFQQTDVSSLFHVHGNGMGRQNGERLAVDPGSGNVLYAGSRDNGLFKSTDSGASWSRLSSLNVTTTPNENGISFVLLDPSSVVGGVAQRVFVGVSRFGSVGPNLYRSDDAGNTFTAVSGAPTAYMPQRAVRASNGNLYITYANGAGPHGNSSQPEPMDSGQIWRYNVASGTWTNVTPSGYTSAFGGISVDPNNPQRLVASTTNQYLQQGNAWGDHFFITTDGGSNWVDVVNRGFAKDPGGVSWISENSIHWAGSIEFDPFNTAAVWVTSGNGIFRTSNIDATPATWTFTVNGLEETVPLNIVSVPNGPLVSVIGDYDGFRHTDVTQYAPVHTPRMGTTTGLAVAAGNTAVVVRVGGSMYYSTNTASSWTQTATMNGSFGQVALSANGSVLLHSPQSSSTTYRSTNFGVSWTIVSGLSSAELRPVADTVNASKFYAYDNGTMRVSTDGGVTFNAAGTLAAWGSKVIRATPGIEGHIWVPLMGGGLARSTNSGTSFSTLANVTNCAAVGFGKAASGANYPTLYIWGTVGGVTGIHQSTDQGATWIRVNDDAHEYGGPGNGQFVTGDMNTFGVVYMSSVGRGIVYGKPADEAADTTPDAFVFVDQKDVARGATVQSNAVSITGITGSAAVSIAGGEYSIGCNNSFTTLGGQITNGQTVCVRHKAASEPSTAVNTTLTVGGISDTFTSTTQAAASTDPIVDTVPDAFAFTARSGVAPGSSVVSNTVTISGLNAPAAISVSNGEYSVSCAITGFTGQNGTVHNGDSVCVRHTAANTPDASTGTTLTIGGVSSVFTSTTAPLISPADPPTNTGKGGGGGAFDFAALLVLAGLAGVRGTVRRCERRARR